MAEYSKEQRNQLSRTIANSESGNRQLKGFVDNRSTSKNADIRYLMSETSCGLKYRSIVQMATIAVGDLDEANQLELKLDNAERKSRGIITDSIGKYRQSHPEEKQIVPWDTQRPLAGLNEDLRIYGHGILHDKNDKEIFAIGGYTAESLSGKLISLGLPPEYSNEIYLTGCKTAMGENGGFLIKFYNLIINDCPKVKVKGNIGSSYTDSDGTQRVFKEGKEDKLQQANLIIETTNAYIKDIKDLTAEYKKQGTTKERKKVILEVMKLISEEIKKLQIEKNIIKPQVASPFEEGNNGTLILP